MNARELRDLRAKLLAQAKLIVDTAEAENRDLNKDEQTQYDDAVTEATSLETRINRLEAIPQTLPVANSHRATTNNRTTALGDKEETAMAAYFRTGDQGAVRGLLSLDEKNETALTIRIPRVYEMRAAVDSTMNITTPGDGGVTVPTGFSGQIAARRGEVRLAERLGVRNVPGKGTTVNYPYESADLAPFATTAEQNDAHTNNYERDALQFLNKPFTLVKKTKKLELTEEILDDEDAALMNHIADAIGRSIGITHNAMLLAEVVANGTALKTFGAVGVIADGEPEAMIYNDVIDYYLDDGGSIAWVMRPSTFGKVMGISGLDRVYGSLRVGGGRSLLEYPVYYSNQAASIGASAKTAFFGNWYYMGMREDPALRLVRDPYTVDGMVILKYSFRTVYGQLIAGAIGYGSQPAV